MDGRGETLLEEGFDEDVLVVEEQHGGRPEVFAGECELSDGVHTFDVW